MSFLQPWLLIALPLISLPIIIHLVNQRRFQTVRWGAMMFLLAANKMSRGYARIRQWLILAARVLAVAGLILAMSRPLASGILGWTAGSQSDATIVLIDRSPSMHQIGANQNLSKLETGCQQLANTLETFGVQRCVVIDSGSLKPQEVSSVKWLRDAPELSATDATADIPAMLESALQYIRVNRLGRTNLWICSDVRLNDWQAESGRWKVLREAFQALPQPVSIHLLAYSEAAPNNLSVRVTEAKRIINETGADLSLSLVVERQSSSAAPSVSVPLQFEVDGARSELAIELEGERFELKDHRIPLSMQQVQGYGVVSLPADENPSDNRFYFLYDEAKPRETLVVTEDPTLMNPVLLASQIAPSSDVTNVAEVVQPSDWERGDWEHLALVVWQGPLPTAAGMQKLQSYVDRGGTVILFPAKTMSNEQAFGIQWQEWEELTEPLMIQSWRGDQDLFAQTQSGSALPVGELRVQGYATWQGETVHLATMANEQPFMARAVTPRGAVYLCATLPESNASNLAENGIVLYVLLQRALEQGAKSLAQGEQLEAGKITREQTQSWLRVAGETKALSHEQHVQAGVYREGERWFAMNRSTDEDRALPLDDERVAGLFAGLEFSRVEDQAGAIRSLVNEVWRFFLIAMLIALISEAALCLPRPARNVV